MAVVIGVLGVAVVGWLVLRWLASTPPAVILQRGRLVGGLALLALAAVFGVTGRWAFAAPLGIFGVGLLRGGVGRLVGPSRPRRSTVRSAAIEMELDHRTGAMDGRILAGSFESRTLGDLSMEELAVLLGELRGDEESRALLEAYLDRREPGWREHVEGDTGAGSRGAPDPGAMSKEEAYEVLGLAPGATPAEIKSAHRRLMKGVHPDQGGSDFLAARINEAKDRLLDHHH